MTQLLPYLRVHADLALQRNDWREFMRLHELAKAATEHLATRVSN